ncbi:MAG: ATP synthase F1 subunit gamma [Clostridium sp.]|jgi:F-type H+-transporting ATPase subunit gamma|nr:ATP synthase F1 subunit gamma [Clostridium sp.]
MPNAREIQSRIRSVQDTMKITNAMYLISSTKLRKARVKQEESKTHFYTLRAMLDHILRHIPETENQYLDMREKKSRSERVGGYLVITADKGLAGAYNYDVLKLAKEQMEQAGKTKLFVVGESGRQYFTAKGVPIDEHFHYTAQNPTLHRARIISAAVLDQFLTGELDEVYLIYTRMKNSLSMEPEAFRLLPMKRQEIELKELKDELYMQPNPKAVLDNIVPDAIRGYIYGALVESYCCEQNSRMMAMEAANKSAKEMIRSLSMEYNRIRQAMITQEITEVVAGAKAQKRKKQKKKREARPMSAGG